MAILEKELWVSLSGNNIKHYESKGYFIPREIDKWGRNRVKRGEKILVNIDDLPITNVKVTKVCDDCGMVVGKRPYRDMLRTSEVDNQQIHRCQSCSSRNNAKNINEKIHYKDSLLYFAEKQGYNHLLLEYQDSNLLDTSKIHKSSKKICLWKCQNCNSYFDMPVNARTNQCQNCPFCAGRRVNDTNCLWSVRPDLSKLLVNKQRGYEVTQGSHLIEEFYCQNCKSITSKTIVEATSRGVRCEKCFDSLSYPEKFMISLLNQLKIDFKKEVTFSWSQCVLSETKELRGFKRYDFYIKKLNLIIETHGQQHYMENEKSNRRELVLERENDLIKKNVAIMNGIDNYCEIDCRKSEKEFIKNNILNSKLSNLFDLSIVDWDKCDEFALGSLLKEVNDIWNSGIKNTQDISETLNISRSTVIRYLNKGSILGLSDYCANKNKNKGLDVGRVNKRKEIVQLSLDGDFIKVHNSVTKASLEVGSTTSSISKVCKNKQKTAGGYRWMYKQDYDKYIKEQKLKESV